MNLCYTFVGRGALLTSTYQYSTQYDDSYLLCITYKAALSAGFDWLEYTGIAGENYIKAGVGNEGKCIVECYVRIFHFQLH